MYVPGRYTSLQTLVPPENYRTMRLLPPSMALKSTWWVQEY